MHIYWSGRTSRASLHTIKWFVASVRLIINDLYVAFQFHPFYRVKVHIKYEKRKNAAIKLSIKDLKGLWKAA